MRHRLRNRENGGHLSHQKFTPTVSHSFPPPHPNHLSNILIPHPPNIPPFPYHHASPLISLVTTPYYTHPTLPVCQSHPYSQGLMTRFPLFSPIHLQFPPISPKWPIIAQICVPQGNAALTTVRPSGGSLGQDPG